MHLGTQEIILILLVALLIFGPARVVDLSKSIGKAVREFRKSLEGKEEEEKEGPSEPPAG